MSSLWRVTSYTCLCFFHTWSVLNTLARMQSFLGGVANCCKYSTPHWKVPCLVAMSSVQQVILEPKRFRPVGLRALLSLVFLLLFIDSMPGSAARREKAAERVTRVVDRYSLIHPGCVCIFVVIFLFLHHSDRTVRAVT